MSNFLLAWIVLIPLLSSMVLGFMYLFSIKVARIPNFVFTMFGVSAPFLSFFIT